MGIQKLPGGPTGVMLHCDSVQGLAKTGKKR